MCMWMLFVSTVRWRMPVSTVMMVSLSCASAHGALVVGDERRHGWLAQPLDDQRVRPPLRQRAQHIGDVDHVVAGPALQVAAEHDVARRPLAVATEVDRAGDVVLAQPA